VRYQIVPLSRVGSTLTIAMTDPTNVFAMDDIKFMTGFNVEPVVASETAISTRPSRSSTASARAKKNSAR
jgi:type IV pilus assembly protein PilB